MPGTAHPKPAAAAAGPWILHLAPPSIEQQALGDALRAGVAGLNLTWIEHPSDALGLVSRGARPDLLLFLDSALHGEGLALIANLRRLHPRLRIAVYGALGRIDCVRWLDAGCDGLLARDVSPLRFIEALRFVLAGNAYVTPQLVAAAPDAVNGCAFLGTCGLGSPIFDQIPAPVVVMQADRYLLVNDAAAWLIGYDRSELLLKRPDEIVVEAHRGFILDALQGWQRGVPVDHEFVVALNHRDGGLVWIASYHRLINIGGRPAVLLVATDLTARLGGHDQARLLAKTPRELAADLTLADRAASAGRATSWPAEHGGQPDLTTRQRQVLELLSGGASNKRIAGQLGISEATAKLHVHRLLRALGARDRAQAVGYGRKLGLITA
ncbi:LuxR C-terminal-related transcriptional regulator [Dongia sp.]|uniref:LuxR C-terminal-related transcriptional regulator n=1 Tax=Dongia sp. TaxID=1977262 RepID=UPI003751509C